MYTTRKEIGGSMNMQNVGKIERMFFACEKEKPYLEIRQSVAKEKNCM